MTKVKSESRLFGMSGMIDHTKYPPLKGYLTISQVAKILGKKRQATLIFAKRHNVQLIRIGDIIIIHESQLDKLR